MNCRIAKRKEYRLVRFDESEMARSEWQKRCLMVPSYWRAGARCAGSISGAPRSNLVNRKSAGEP